MHACLDNIIQISAIFTHENICLEKKCEWEKKNPNKQKTFTAFYSVKAKSFVNSPAPFSFVSNQLRQPQKSYKPNSTICAGLCWSTFVFLLLYSPNSKVWDLSICPWATAAHTLLSRLMHKHQLNRWIPDGCIGAIRYLSQTTDSGVLFPVTAALMETLSFLMYQLHAC